MKKADYEYDLTKSMLSKMRKVNEDIQTKRNLRARQVLKEEDEKNDDKKKDRKPIAITNDAKFGQSVLQNQIDSFKQTVNSGAKFGAENQEKPENNPLVFFPNTGNLVFSGSIPTMSNLKFQFSLNDVTNAPYIFVDGLALTDDVVTTLNKLHGFYLNWKEEWQTASDLLDKLSKEKED